MGQLVLPVHCRFISVLLLSSPFFYLPNPFFFFLLLKWVFFTIHLGALNFKLEAGEGARGEVIVVKISPLPNANKKPNARRDRK